MIQASSQNNSNSFVFLHSHLSDWLLCGVQHNIAQDSLLIWNKTKTIKHLTDNKHISLQ